MTWIYMLELATVMAAIPLMLWLRREGDRNWRRHQRRLRSARFAAIGVAMPAVAVSLFAWTTGMVRAAAEAEEAARRLERALSTPVKPVGTHKNFKIGEK